MKNSEVTRITGHRYNIFGVNLTLTTPNKEEQAMFSKNSQTTENQDFTIRDIAETAKDIETQEEAIAVILRKHNESKKHILGILALVVISIVLGMNIYLSMIFLAPMALFYIRMLNFSNDYTLRSGFLAFSRWSHEEIKQTVYGQNISNPLPFEITDDMKIK